MSEKGTMGRDVFPPPVGASHLLISVSTLSFPPIGMNCQLCANGEIDERYYPLNIMLRSCPS